MSLDRAIAAGKERRAPYRGSARFDGHCRNHNPRRMQCPWCVANRTVRLTRVKADTELAREPFVIGPGMYGHWQEEL